MFKCIGVLSSLATALAGVMAGRLLGGLASMALILAAPTVVSAASQTGTITKVIFIAAPSSGGTASGGPAGRVLFYVSGAKTGWSPACDANGTAGPWEISTSTAWGQALMSVMMTAYAQGKQININGSGACVLGAYTSEGVASFQSN